MNETTNDRPTRHSSRRHRARGPRGSKETRPLNLPDYLPATTASSAGSPPQARGRLVAGLVIAALIVGAAGMRWFDQSSRATTPKWFAACREAVDATAQLHRLQDAQFAQAMELTWAAVGGVSAHGNTIDRPEISRLQRNADEATRRCIAPAAP